MAHSDAPHISMETAIAAEETQLASVENVRRASVELQRACQDIVREADREKEDTREKEHALQDSLAYIAIEPYRERLGDNRRGALVLGYRHSARLGRDVKVVAAEKSDYCKLAEASSEEEKRNILKRLDSSEDERNAEQAAWTEWKKNQEGVIQGDTGVAVDAPSGGIPSAPAGGIPSKSVQAGITRANEVIKLRKKIWGLKKGKRDGAHKKKHDGAHQNVKGIDLRPVPKVRRTTEEIAYLESFHVHDGTQADDGDDLDADSRN